ncbi:MAG: hypothetical protein Q8R25_01640 [bacterium]|nr:hypothetical protein [bacterium]
MVEQIGIDKAKGGNSQDEKKVVAGGIAITIVVILIIGWAVLFVRKIQSGSQNVQLGGGAQDNFNFTSVKEAQQQLQNSYSNVSKDLKDLRDQAQSAGVQIQQLDVVHTGDTDSDQFTTPN